MSDPSHFVYILRCSDRSLYIRHTEDLAERLTRHNTGRGYAFTAHRRPVTLVHSEPFTTKSEANQRERQLKRWSHAKKDALITGKLGKLRSLSRCRSLQGGA